mmetsp:Transcript_13709/g.29453  ORF Transcript_13709/g.29453 Transcript_13709/m.29453 type:complete len:269 (-) Transcript_13709:1246-2052(-)
MAFCLIQEGHDLCEGAVFEHDHVLGQVLNQCDEAALRIEPGVSLQLLVVGLQALDDAADAKLIVALCTVQCSDDQVNDAEVEALLARHNGLGPLLLLLHLAHQLLCLLILAGHDVGDTEVGQNDGGDIQQLVLVLLDDWLIVLDCLLVVVVLHEEGMRHVELPHLVLAAELLGLPEDLFHSRVVLHLPVDGGHGHQTRDVRLQGLIILVDGPLDGVLVTGHACILDLLCQAAQHFHVPAGQLIKPAECLLRRARPCNGGVQEVLHVLA